MSINVDPVDLKGTLHSKLVSVSCSCHDVRHGLLLKLSFVSVCENAVFPTVFAEHHDFFHIMFDCCLTEYEILL